MTVCVFLGPTLPRGVARRLLPEAILLPPVRQGDVLRVVEQQAASAIGLIDGYFRQVPAVWHKEILWALSRGVRVVGGASMGALRAAELAEFGMQGIGLIHAAYQSGELPPYRDAFENDDEVAILHGPAELDYRPLSEALVNIRCTLAAAADEDVIQANTRDRLLALAKALFYPQRGYPLLLRQGRAAGLAGNELEALEGWLPVGRIDRKRSDALAVLDSLREPARGAAETVFAFEPTTLWQSFRQAALRRPPTEDEARVLARLQQDPDHWRYLCEAALLRVLCEAEPQGQDSAEARAVALQHWRERYGLLSRAQLENWLRRNALEPDHWRRLLDIETALTTLMGEQGDLSRRIIDHLRWTGEWSRLIRQDDGA